MLDNGVRSRKTVQSFNSVLAQKLSLRTAKEEEEEAGDRNDLK